MLSSNPRTNAFFRFSYKSLRFLTYFGLAAFVTAMWVIDMDNNTNMADYTKARFESMIYGTAYKPYVFRTLLPSTVRAIMGLIPDGVQVDLAQGVLARFPVVAQFMDVHFWNREYVLEYIVAILLIFLCMVGFVWTIRALFRTLYEAPWWVEDLVPFFALLVLPVYFIWGTHFLYDFPTLFLFSLALLFLRRQQWPVFYVIYILALFNKETAVLLVAITALYYFRRLPLREYILHLAAQSALFLLVKGFLTFIYRENIGRQYEIHFLLNLRDALVPYEAPALAATLLFFILIFRHFSQKPLYLRRALLIYIPLFFSYMLMGRYGEIRVFYEGFAVIFLLGFHTFADLLGWPLRPRDDTRPPIRRWRIGRWAV